MKRCLLLLPAVLLLLFLSCPGTVPAARIETETDDLTLIECLNKAAGDISSILHSGSIIAVIGISSDEAGEGDFAEEQLIFFFVTAGKYRIVERRELDKIRDEQIFHLSGEVDDRTAVSIGRMAGAGTIIVGTILPYGGGKYLSLRALDVESSEILAVSSRFYSGGIF